METIYFDYNATTPLDPAVRDAMLPFLGEIWGNPSSIHRVGREARAALDDARERAAARLRAKPSEIIFTSGGTESNCLAIFGTARHLMSKGRHLITSAVEHQAVLQSFRFLSENEGFEVSILPVDREGRVNPADLKAALRPDTILVSVQAANNEIGTIQPVAELGAICRDRGIIFHTDAVQWFGKMPFAAIGQFNADLVTICSHKFHGPKGAGILFIRSPLIPLPILFGGEHENERRAGTENLPAIMGLASALDRFVSPPVFVPEDLSILSNCLRSSLSRQEGISVLSPSRDSLPNTVSFLVSGAETMGLMANFDLEGFCVSSGSACSAGSLKPSHVVSALEVSDAFNNPLVRVSFGRGNSLIELETFSSKLPLILERSRILKSK